MIQDGFSRQGRVDGVEHARAHAGVRFSLSAWRTRGRFGKAACQSLMQGHEAGAESGDGGWVQTGGPRPEGLDR